MCGGKELPRKRGNRITECVWGRSCGKRQKDRTAGFGINRKPEAGTASVPELPRCNAYYRSEIGGNVNYGTERNTSKHLCDSQKLI